ncbi:hypothetical protein AJ80_01088 [Polytolypa hystricis UAMH7299]|uniref:Uncharacterized protein n=1 Tax=Polytolypa hystricis (strain UAMH7299) TaxID=1447883 RepID=A0A2B7Z227_POLH7|nr:hypothetical protein AJ80_01088 [Polytolypa hystricis UAMH7299]
MFIAFASLKNEQTSSLKSRLERQIRYKVKGKSGADEGLEFHVTTTGRFKRKKLDPEESDTMKRQAKRSRHRPVNGDSHRGVPPSREM